MPINPYNKYIKQYQANNVNTATPEKLMLMLLDAAIQFLQKAKTAVAEKKLSERAENIDATRKILRELMRTIDLENGNSVSKQLFRFYNKLTMKLLKANIQKDGQLIQEIIDDIMNIRWGFEKAIQIESGMVTVEEVMKEYTASNNNPLHQNKPQQEDNNAG